MRSPVSRSPWCLHGPVRPTRVPKNFGRNCFLLHLHRTCWLWRIGQKGILWTDTRTVFPGGSSHAVREPVPADVFADQVAPAVCKQKMRCAWFLTWSAYPPTPVVSEAAVAGNRVGVPAPFGVWSPLMLRWYRVFTPVRAKHLLPAMGSPPFRGPPGKPGAVRVLNPSRRLPKPPSTPRADLRRFEADSA